MLNRAIFLTSTLGAVCGFGLPDRFSVSWSMAEDSRGRSTVEFIVGDYLLSEGGDWEAAQSPLRGPFGIDFDSSGAMFIVELSSGRLHKRPMQGELKTLRERHEKGYSGDGGGVTWWRHVRRPGRPFARGPGR